ncbi:DUF2382 domain-containing protein [Cellulosimicrobium sp. NPDC057127]|uniref:DUF2382 domain-containing protein n=1 Tax=Cellulosimicrobium sp. NPDC057127 TaxID=3346026 RepID=UPI00362701D5
MIETHQIDSLLTNGGTVTDTSGQKIGKIGQIFLDDTTGRPEWVTVSTGLFGTGESFVPLADATVQGDDIRVPFGKDKVKDAPRVDDSEGHLSPDEEAELYRYYGRSDYGTPAGTGGTPGAGDRTGLADRTGTTGTVGHDTSGPETDDAMTRSEERLDVGTERVQAGKARLRKYVVTENVTRTVPVSHEEVRVEREPITDANRGAAMSGGNLTSEEHEVELHAERPVVDKETVPTERVRLGTETVTEDEQVTEQVRKEQIETDLPDGPESGRRR